MCLSSTARFENWHDKRLTPLCNSNTCQGLYRVRVKRKGQVTIPARIREKMNIDEGTMLEVEERPEGILLKAMSGIKAGEIVGRKEHAKIIGQLDGVRSEWL